MPTGDPNDRNFFWTAQTVMADALNQAQIPVQLLQGQGSGSEAHDLSNSSRVVAGWCAREMGTDEIVGWAARGSRDEVTIAVSGGEPEDKAGQRFPFERHGYYVTDQGRMRRTSPAESGSRIEG